MSLKILHAVEFYAPSVGGAQEVVRQISERLVARGHSVTVATSRLPQRTARCLNGVAIEEFDVRGNEVRGLEGQIDAYRRFVLDGDFDVVLLYAAQQWTTDALLPVVRQIPAATLLAPCGFSGLRNPAYAAYFEHLERDLLDFNHLIFHSSDYQDIRFARAAGVERLTVIPNGADEREFGEHQSTERFRSAHGISSGKPLVLTVGSHTGLKGHADAIAALRSAKEARDGTLAIVGNTPTGRGCSSACRARALVTRAGGRRVVLDDPPRQGVIDAYLDADLFVFCSAVECSPLVLFEAMAAGLPFVTVDAGNAAEIVDWSGAGVVVESPRRRNGLVRPDRAGVARAIDELLADNARRAEMGHRGRKAWRDRFTWDAVAGRYEDLYRAMAT
jgi:glycosyltransferase involved in cell wall biosynthesis